MGAAVVSLIRDTVDARRTTTRAEDERSNPGPGGVGGEVAHGATAAEEITFKKAVAAGRGGWAGGPDAGATAEECVIHLCGL